VVEGWDLSRHKEVRGGDGMKLGETVLLLRDLKGRPRRFVSVDLDASGKRVAQTPCQRIITTYSVQFYYRS
jgi:hypothetical protein